MAGLIIPPVARRLYDNESHRLLVLKTLAAVSKWKGRYIYRDLVRPLQSVFSLALEDSLRGTHTLRTFLAGGNGTSALAPVVRTQHRGLKLNFSLALSKIDYDLPRHGTSPGAPRRPRAGGPIIGARAVANRAAGRQRKGFLPHGGTPHRREPCVRGNRRHSAGCPHARSQGPDLPRTSPGHLPAWPIANNFLLSLTLFVSFATSGSSPYSWEGWHWLSWAHFASRGTSIS